MRTVSVRELKEHLTDMSAHHRNVDLEKVEAQIAEIDRLVMTI